MTLNGSRYSLASLTLGQGATVNFTSDSGVILEVRGAVSLQGTFNWVLQKIPANRLLVSLPSATTLIFFGGQQIKGTFFAPNAVVSLSGGGGLTGALWAKTIKLGSGTIVTGSPWVSRVKVTSPPKDSVIRAASTKVKWTADSTSQTIDTLESWTTDGTYWVARCAWGTCDSVRVTRSLVQPVKITNPATFSYVNKPKLAVTWTIGGVVQPIDTTVLVEGLNKVKRCANSVCDSVQTILDTKVPVVAIVSPANLSWTNKSKVAVSWTVDGGAIRVDSLPVVEGSNPLTRTWTDSAGNVGSATVVVRRDTQSPVVAIVSPANLSWTNKSKVAVSWTVDGGAVRVDSLPVVEGSNPLTRTWTDSAGNVGSATVVVRRDTQSPVVTIVSPANLSWTNQPKVAVSWTVDGGAVRVDSLPVVEGSNPLTRTWTDSAGNVGSAAVVVRRDTQVPVVLITSPANGAVVSASPITVQWTVDGEAFQESRALVDGTNPILKSFTDSAGNSGADSVVVTLATNPPVVRILQPSNYSMLSNSHVEVVWQVDSVIHREFVDLQAGANTLVRSGSNAAGIVAADSVRVFVDGIPPVGEWVSPADSLRKSDSLIQVALRVSDSGSGVGRIEFLLDGTDFGAWLVPDSTGVFSAALTPARGWHELRAAVIDGAGNRVELPARHVMTGVVESPIHIESPLPLAMLNGLDVEVSGRFDVPLLRILVDGVVATVQGDRFRARVSLLEGRNTLTVSGTDEAGIVRTATVTVVVDRTAPDVRIESPRDGDVFRQSRIAVSGSVSDRIISMAQAEQSRVLINGSPARVSNQSYYAQMDLLPGQNLINAISTDPFGNASGRSVRVVYDTSKGSHLVVQGDTLRRGRVRQFLIDSLGFQLVDDAGSPLAGDTILFRVVQGSGVLSGVLDSGARLGLAVTNAQGFAKTAWRLGRRGGPGANRLRAEALHGMGTVEVAAEALPDSLGRIQAAGGEHQRGAAGYPAPFPVVALATDTLNNPLPGVNVVFRVVEGGGHFNGSDSAVVLTGADGKAAVLWTLGSTEGIENNRVEASFAENVGLPAVFQASSLVPGGLDSTRVSGLVLDNQNQPIPGATLILDELGVRATSDSNGVFRMVTPAAGIHHLTAVGSTSTRPGKWVSLHFEINLVAGRDNTLGMPIFLLAESENPISVKVPRVDSAVTLTVPEVPGFSLTIPPGSARFPFTADNSKRAVSVTQVHLDKIPMPPGEGMQPVVVVSIMPHDVRFDIPAPVSFPNVDHLPPGEQTPMYSFDHDLGTFVKIGTGTVSEDGAVINSDPGFGIVHGGWHCAGPGNPTGQVCKKPKIEIAKTEYTLAYSGRNGGKSLIIPVSVRGSEGRFFVENFDESIVTASFTQAKDKMTLSLTGGAPGIAKILISYIQGDNHESDKVEIIINTIGNVSLSPDASDDGYGYDLFAKTFSAPKYRSWRIGVASKSGKGAVSIKLGEKSLTHNVSTKTSSILFPASNLESTNIMIYTDDTVEVTGIQNKVSFFRYFELTPRFYGMKVGGQVRCPSDLRGLMRGVSKHTRNGVWGFTETDYNCTSIGDVENFDANKNGWFDFYFHEEHWWNAIDGYPTTERKSIESALPKLKGRNLAVIFLPFSMNLNAIRIASIGADRKHVCLIEENVGIGNGYVERRLAENNNLYFRKKNTEGEIISIAELRIQSYLSEPDDWGNERCIQVAFSDSVPDWLIPESEVGASVASFVYPTLRILSGLASQKGEANLIGVVLDNEQESTFAHEVGHTLGLYHCGKDEPRCTEDEVSNLMHEGGPVVGVPSSLRLFQWKDVHQ
ncbi:MAG: hypothetical protein IPO40_16710 [Fibrobacteres bacterium]|nr:hypothetical protein [Fibrobacterota bacterium]